MTYEIAAMPRITGGPGAAARVGERAAALAGRAPVLLVADPGLRASGAIGRIAASLRKAGCKVETFSAFSGDPTIAQTDSAAERARARAARAVVSLGGGSALDLGKTVAAIAPTRRSAAYYDLAKRPFTGRRLASIVIPTTSGTGSEATRVAVLTRADNAKTWLWDNALKADEIILDPELTLTLPPALTAATGMDALVHAIEAATNRNAHAANNLAAHEAIRLVAAHLERAVAHGGDLAAREAMQRAAMLAGQAIDNAGTAIAHNIGHALGSLGKVHHGRAVTLGMIATLPFNVAGDDGPFAEVAKAMGLRGGAKAVPKAFADLARSVGIETSLARDLPGVTPERLAAQMAQPENAAMRRSNRRAVSDGDLLAFARDVLAG
jgi:alcohol dehydrogenase class IV